MRRALGPAIALLLAALAAPASAQERWQRLAHSSAPDPIPELTLSSLEVPGTGIAPLGYGYLLVECRNDGDEERVITVELEPSYSRAQYSATRAFAVPPRSTRRVSLPLVGGSYQSGTTMQVLVDGQSDLVSPTFLGNTGGHMGSSNQPILALALGQDDVMTVARGTGTAQAVHDREPDELPERAMELTAFPLVVLDATSPGLTPERQGVLRDYVAFGGQLLVLSPGHLIDGPLKDLIAASSAEGPSRAPVRYGLGQLEWRATVRQSVLLRTSHGVGFSESIPDTFLETLEIPGLGDIPVQLFVALIVGFVILVGPVNYLYFRRRKRPTLALVVAPIAGVGLTSVILLWGIFGEGFATRTASRSLTLLDQRTHEAVAVTHTTYYAGLSVPPLRPSPGAYVHRGGLVRRNDRLSIEYNPGLTLGSSFIPARSPTGVVSIERRTERARLRFRREERELALLADEAIQPDELLVRDHQGQLYMLAGGAKLKPIPREGAEAWAERVLVHGSGAVTVGSRWSSTTFGLAGNSLKRWIAERLDAPREVLPPGTYLARTKRRPGQDPLGLEADELSGWHIVLGTLAEEDIARE